ncbi:MAG: amidohydrolase [Acidobacteria bacterium RIFCSPLOWO2_02_FULL_68_18]|nr:MAG: amidohydrolase [Acidobacteria bacterium RIFCSPLOWO2_02_FULL_68_18]OFW49550.1 MAG: amidohydrolase [Acidobacteria bacterium RIFCSPLOWO2_12_FULL_68_19]
MGVVAALFVGLVALAIVSAQTGRRLVSLVVRGGIVVTMDGTRGVIEDGAVAVDGANIVAVDTAAAIGRQFQGGETIDASGQVVLPGLVNTHTHAPMVLYRGLADDLALMEWLTKYMFPAEAKTVSPDFVRAGTRLAALEMIRSGTTTYADMYYFEEEVARETKTAGLRGVLGQTIIGFPVADAKTPADALVRAEAFIASFKGDALITPAVAPHAIYTLDGSTLTAARTLARRHGVPTLIHLAETRDEVKIAQERFNATPVTYLERLGFLGPGVLAAHAIWVSDAEIALLRTRGVGVSHNPESNMKLASGMAPVTDYRAVDVAIGLGTDGAASNNDLDMFEAMRVASLLQKVRTGDPRALGATAALELATIGGARALGMASHIGSLEPGKYADLIIVGMTAARQTPMYDPVSHLVYTTRGDDVRTTIVSGRVLMRDGKVLSLDEAAVLAEARRWSVKVRAAVN